MAETKIKGDHKKFGVVTHEREVGQKCTQRGWVKVTHRTSGEFFLEKPLVPLVTADTTGKICTKGEERDDLTSSKMSQAEKDWIH